MELSGATSAVPAIAVSQVNAKPDAVRLPLQDAAEAVEGISTMPKTMRLEHHATPRADM
ncbi:MAG TPA: hypothetical protein VGN69_08430 [Solirubrobacteraceae bacterium]|nr:hypothetical protein [Solirubrobacteraceae bacterium]